MIFYLSIEQLQEKISRSYQADHICPDFETILKELYQKKEYTTDPPKPPEIEKFLQLNDSDFLNASSQLYYAFSSEQLLGDTDYDLVPEFDDMVTISQFYRTQNNIHTHDCFEIDYIFKGKCELTFLDEKRILEEGDFCILSPYAKHTTRLLTEKSCVYPIFVKEKTFDAVFFSALSGSDILSNFFRQILTNPSEPNYLLFQTTNSAEIRMLVKLLFLERFRMDTYVNRCGIHWLNLLFVNVLRNYNTYSQFSYYDSGSDYMPIMRYIKTHYKTISLEQLSKKFHYSVPYMSKIIKKITGDSFTETLRKLKMEEASNLLIQSDDSIEKISEQAGYHSSDHFTRTFRKYYGISPLKYRKKYRQY